VKNKKKTMIRPLGRMVLIVHDGAKKTTNGGIILPDTCKIEVLTGRIIKMSAKMIDDELEYPFRELDHVIYDTRHAIPVDFEHDNKHYLIDYEYLYGVVAEEERE
jgi:co-chaperonin GroES (HSP10)